MEEPDMKFIDWVKLIVIIPYALIQIVIWLATTISVFSDFYCQMNSIEWDRPDWFPLVYIGYFIWTNYLIRNL